MKTRLIRMLGLFCYLFVLGLLFGLDWNALYKPRQLLLVLFGAVILTACQYKKGLEKEELLAALRWNAMLAGFLTTLVCAVSAGSQLVNSLTPVFAAHMLPLLYGSVLYLLGGILLFDGAAKKPPASGELFEPELRHTLIAEQVFKTYSLTKRECHVAQKLLQDLSNKEIASELFISETTVKKHVQNIYQKCGTTGRASFLALYYSRARYVLNGQRPSL